MISTFSLKYIISDIPLNKNRSRISNKNNNLIL